MFQHKLSATLTALCFTVMHAPTATAQSDTLEFSVQDARQIALRALDVDEFELARKLAMGLLLADATDSHAYTILMQAHAQLGHPKLAKAAARLAYQYSDGKAESFSAALNAGSLAFHNQKYNAAQFWLRRAANHEPNEQSAKMLAADYAKIRAANPLSFNINVSASPSDNLNNGANSSENLVNGTPQLGYINASSRALSGIVATTDLQLRYRLNQNANSRTDARARVYVNTVSLSSEARALMASDPFSRQLKNSDLGSTYADIGIDHRFALGTAGAVATLSAKLGNTWSGQNKNYTFGQVGFSPSFRLAPKTRLSLGTLLEKRWSDIAPKNDLTRSQVSATLHHRIDNGNHLSFGLSLQDISSDGRNISNKSAVANINYSFAKPVASIKVSTGLSLGYTHYEGFSIFGPVEGGRSDMSVTGNVTMVFTKLDVAGFVPSVQVQTGRKSSNISRFNSNEMSVSLGIQSKF